MACSNKRCAFPFAYHNYTTYLCCMFKRVSILTILLLYLVTASGVAVNLHYCGKYLASVQVNAPAKKCSPVKMKCCHDKHFEVKVKDAHKIQPTSFAAKLFYFDLPKLLLADFLPSLQGVTEAPKLTRGPPDPDCGTPVYIKNCTYRI